MTKQQPNNNNEQPIIQLSTTLQVGVIEPQKKEQEEEQEQLKQTQQKKPKKSFLTLPHWASEANKSQWGTKLNILEWDDDLDGNGGINCDGDDVNEYRSLNGWKGNDLIHSMSSPVRVLEYRLCYPTNATNATNATDATGEIQSSLSSCKPSMAKVTGIVHFTKNAESHQGYCHGGSMCSIMDDIIGWTGFCATGTCIPWSGFTVQINTKLSKPVKVDTMLQIVCTITKIERRKVWLKAYLIDPDTDTDTVTDTDTDTVGIVSESRHDLKNDDGVLISSIHAEGEGLVILNKGVMEGVTSTLRN